MKSRLTLTVVGDAPAAAAALLETFRDYAQVTSAGETHTVGLRYGQAVLVASKDQIAIIAEAADAIRLSYVKMAVAEHWAALAVHAAGEIAWEGVVAGDQTPPFFQTIEVVSSRLLTPHMKRISFRGKSFRAYAEGGLHVRLIFPPSGRIPVWPSVGADGRIVWPGGEDALAARVYTIRRIDLEQEEIEIDFVLHQPGDHEAPGAAFGNTARRGDEIGIFAPGGNEIPDAASLLLFGDETALPAMARIIDTLPQTSAARVFVEVDGPQDHYDFRHSDQVEICYLYRDGREAGTTDLLVDALRQCSPSIRNSAPFVWAGCEMSSFLAIRRFAREDMKLARENHSVVAYWRKR